MSYRRGLPSPEATEQKKLILEALKTGNYTLGELEKITSIPPKELSSRLQTLLDGRVIERNSYKQWKLSQNPRPDLPDHLLRWFGYPIGVTA